MEGMIDSDRFGKGLCLEFSIAMKTILGYDIAVVYGVFEDKDGNEGDTYEIPSHTFSLHPKDKSLGIDCRGIRPITKIVSQSGFIENPMKVKWKEDSMKNIIDLFGVEPDSEEIRKSIIFIKKNINVYKV